MTPEVKAIFEAVPLDREMTVQDFSEVVDNIPFMTERWATEAKGKLFEMARDHLTKIFAPEVVPDFALDLAMAVRCFCCRCHDLLDCSSALTHQEHPLFYVGSHNGDAGVFKANTGERLWSADHFEFYDVYLNRAKGAVQALGYDPRIVTTQLLDELDEIFECTTCTSYERAARCSTGEAWLIMRPTAMSMHIQRGSNSNEGGGNRIPGLDGFQALDMHSLHDITALADADVVLASSAAGKARSLRYWNFGTTLLI
ncbi:hypothetical protein BKA70DRAFT_1214885 [Coprinopsis sp. MPI-PUGE-AT-0042]|nr:hypothetical protein BKA70DRAFT_1214885 [Coprinopsis sp. MPI-PUGE-AT-0042]